VGEQNSSSQAKSLEKNKRKNGTEGRIDGEHRALERDERSEEKKKNKRRHVFLIEGGQSYVRKKLTS